RKYFVHQWGLTDTLSASFLHSRQFAAKPRRCADAHDLLLLRSNAQRCPPRRAAVKPCAVLLGYPVAERCSGGPMSFLVELPQSEYNPDAFKQFDPAAAFSKGNALAMAWISQLAYETRLPDKIRAIGALWDLADISIVQQPAKSTLPLSDTRAVMAS